MSYRVSKKPAIRVSKFSPLSTFTGGDLHGELFPLTPMAHCAQRLCAPSIEFASPSGAHGRHVHNHLFISAQSTTRAVSTISRSHVPYCSPKPWAFCIAIVSRSRSFAREVYSGIVSILKHVCAVGSCIESGPALCKMKRKLASPPIGARSHPVAKKRRRRWSSAVIE